jgi:PAS domain S-box-containing protein
MFFLNIFVAAFLSAAMVYYMLIQKTYNGFGWWTLSTALAAFTYTIMLSMYFFTGTLPELISIAVANTCVPLIMIIKLHGVKKFFGEKGVSSAYFILPAAVFIIYGYFYYVVPDITKSQFVESVIVCFISIMLAWEFIKHMESDNPKLNVAAAWLYAIFGSVFLLKGIFILLLQSTTFMTDSIVDTVFFTLLPLFEISWSVVFLMLNSQRVYNELGTALREKVISSEAAIAASADYREIFNNSNDAIFVDDIAAGSMIDANKKATEMYGYTVEQIRNMDFGVLSSGEPGYTQAEAIGWIMKAITGEPQVFEWKAKDKQGRIFWVEVSLKRAKLGGIDRVISAIRDIDERKHAEEERRANEEKMQQVQRLESLGVMAGGIAHDFNNLLMVIMGNIDMGRMSIPVDSQAFKFLSAAEKACLNAADITKQMLAYAGRGRALVHSVNINDVIDEINGILTVNISKKVKINYTLDKNMTNIAADSSQIKQLVMNLVINASEAIGDNEGMISVRTGISHFTQAILPGENILMVENLKNGSFGYIEVKDTGCGIDEKNLGMIFDPFFTTKFIGRGLGLATVIGIVRNMGGAVKVESVQGRGSVFTLYLPAQPSGSQTGDNVKAKGIVLLVDDEEDVLVLGEQMIDALGYKTIIAKNGAEAVEIVKNHSVQGEEEISFVLLDIGMPVMDGYDAFEKIREIAPGIKVFISSGYGQSDIEKRFKDKTIAGMLNKPYNVADLKKVLEGALI